MLEKDREVEKEEGRGKEREERGRKGRKGKHESESAVLCEVCITEEKKPRKRLTTEGRKRGR